MSHKLNSAVSDLSSNSQVSQHQTGLILPSCCSLSPFVMSLLPQTRLPHQAHPLQSQEPPQPHSLVSGWKQQPAPRGRGPGRGETSREGSVSISREEAAYSRQGPWVGVSREPSTQYTSSCLQSLEILGQTTQPTSRVSEKYPVGSPLINIYFWCQWEKCLFFKGAPPARP